MKRFLTVILVLLGLIFPFACSENKPNPVNPSPIIGATFTPTGTLPTATFTFSPTPTGTLATATFTYTGTVSTATFTFTPTPTWTFIAAPPFSSNWAASAAPNGFYYNGGTLYIVEGEVAGGGNPTMFETFNTAAPAPPSAQGNIAVLGIPTPGLTPPWQGTQAVLKLPQGIAFTPAFGGWFALLDQTSGTDAILYESPYYFMGPETDYTTSYGGAPFVSPKAVVGDSLGNFYVADTGRGYVDMFGVGCACANAPYNNPPWLHRWYGPSVPVTFKRPNTLAISPSTSPLGARDHVFVGDSGYTPSKLQEYASGGTTILGSWDLIPNCVINGLAVDDAGNIYVSDTGNGGQVEEYRISPYPTVPTSTLSLVRKWGDPLSPNELYPFVPSCISLIPGAPSGLSTPSQIIVGDTGNDFIQVFTGP